MREVATKIQPAEQILKQIRHGRFMNEVSEHLYEVSQAVSRHQKSGSVTLTIKIAPEPGTDGLQAQVIADVKSTLPRPTVPKQPMYIDQDGLHRENPRQGGLSGVPSADQAEAANE